MRIVNSQVYRDITGRAAPESPISARTYTEHGLPWFDLYDEHLGDVGGSDILGAVETVKEIDKKKGFASQQDDGTVVIDADQVITKPVPEKWPKFS